jgi:hypothetical protein
VSLKLNYAIQVVGDNTVYKGYYLNQESTDEINTQAYSLYRFLQDDIAKTLNISYYRAQILFLKAASQDVVLVYFRISPS